MQDAIAQAEDICEPPEYLPKEDDHNNIEYKFYMCNITFNKLEKRHTQMSYRLNVSWLITQIFHIPNMYAIWGNSSVVLGISSLL